MNKRPTTAKLQKENAPREKDMKDLKSVKVSVVNDFKEKSSEPMLSVKIDVTSNRKTVKIENEELPRICEDDEKIVSSDKTHADDYKSPLDALSSKG